MSYSCDVAKPRTIFSWNEGKISAMGEILHDNQRIPFIECYPGKRGMTKVMEKSPSLAKQATKADRT